MVTYRLAQESDYESINNFYNCIYKSTRTLDQFYWEFNNGPFGSSIYVIAEERDEIIGTNCVIPIDFVTSDKKIIRSGKSEDTLVDPKYRGQKIFYKMYDFLFEKCKENGIQVIWGFTSAKKPFKRLGFSIPFEHQQSLVVNNIWKGYKYLSSLNKKNSFIDKSKIFALSCLSKIKIIGGFNSKLSGYTISEDKKVTQDIDELINTNLLSLESSLAILQNAEFQKWRIYNNPNYYKIHTFGFYNTVNKLVALIVLNSHENKIAYIIQSSFVQGLDTKERVNILQFVTQKMFASGIHLIRNWHFDTNKINKQENEVFRASHYMYLNKGIAFVWKELEDLDYKPENIYLSRVSTQGVI